MGVSFVCAWGGGGNVRVNLQHPFLPGSSAKKIFYKNQEILLFICI